MFSPRLIQALAVIAAAVLFAGISQITPGIKTERDRTTMIGSADSLKTAPPEYVLAVQAGGAVRALMTNILFIRAEQFKEQGRFYDAKQLADLICTLQPRFPSVWEFAAWNMSWNISVTTYTPEERWNWVYNGIKLIRDKGIPNNPRSMNLHKQIAWTYCNKISESIDDMHLAYKANWAWRMHLVLGPPAPVGVAPEAVYGPTAEKEGKEPEYDPLKEALRQTSLQNEDRRRAIAEARGQKFVPLDPNAPLPDVDPRTSTAFERARKAEYDRIKLIADAPETLDALYAKFPETKSMVEALRQFGVKISDSKLDEDDFLARGGLGFTFFDRYRKVAEPNTMLAKVSRDSSADSALAQVQLSSFDQIVGVTKKNPAGQALFAFMQRKVLQDVYALDLQHMLRTIRNFGPVDWRSPDAHGLYWVTLGIERGGETLSTIQNDKINTSRLVFFSLRNLWLRGKITFEPHPDPSKIYLSYLSFANDENMIAPMQWAYLTFAPALDPEAGPKGGVGETYRGGHINFLTEAVRALYMSGREDEAEYYYGYLRDTYSTRPDGSHEKLYDQTLYDFVEQDMYDSISTASNREAGLVIVGFLNRAFRMLSDGDVAGYNSFYKRAKQMHTVFMKDKRGTLSSRQALPEWNDMLSDVFAIFLMQPVGMPGETLRKIKLWDAADPALKQLVYDVMLPGLTEECNAWNFDVTKAFTEPIGMGEFRKNNPNRFKDEVDKVDTENMRMDQ